MSSLPWSTDRPLDEQTVQTVVAAQFPSLQPVHATYLGEGWDNQSYVINERWVFRFPKRREYDALIATEAAALTDLAPSLPVPAPLPTFMGEPCEQFPYRFWGYSMLHGTPACDFNFDTTCCDTIVRQYAETFSVVHAFDVPEAKRLGVRPVSSDESVSAHYKYALNSHENDRYALGSLPDPVRRGCVAFLEGDSPLPDGYAGPPCFCHGDLLPEHVLIDGDPPQISGIIDWADMLIGDPAMDFVGLWLMLGDAAVREALDLYRLPVDAGMLDRIRVRGRCCALGEWQVSVEHFPETLPRNRAQLLRAFGA